MNNTPDWQQKPQQIALPPHRWTVGSRKTSFPTSYFKAKLQLNVDEDSGLLNTVVRVTVTKQLLVKSPISVVLPKEILETVIWTKMPEARIA
jgi:hypothetical protein